MHFLLYRERDWKIGLSMTTNLASLGKSIIGVKTILNDLIRLSGVCFVAFDGLIAFSSV